MLTRTHILSYASIEGLPIRQIVAAILLALLLHALVLLAYHWSSNGPTLTARHTIEVSLEMPVSNSTPETEKRPPPKQAPMPEKTPVEEPATQDTPPIEEPPPQTPATTAVATPAQNNVAEEIQPLFRLTRMPGFLKKTEATYPASERRAGIQASVLTEVTIDSRGNVLEVRILKSGGAAFDEAVKQALQNSTFTPGMIDNQPVGTRFQVPFRFNLN